MRSALTVIAGLVAGMFSARLALWMLRGVAPLPPDLAVGDFDALRGYLLSAPSSYFLVLLASWAVSALVGGVVAAFLAPRRRLVHALVVGAIQTALAALQLSMLPHPAWVVASGLALFVPLAALGALPFAKAPDVSPAA